MILTSACSGALELSINVLCNAGQNILVPKPGFAIYRCLAGAKQVEPRYYNLKVSFLINSLNIFSIFHLVLNVLIYLSASFHPFIFLFSVTA